MGIAPNTYQESIGYNVVRQIFEGLMQYKVAADGVTMDTVPDLCTGRPRSAPTRRCSPSPSGRASTSSRR